MNPITNPDKLETELVPTDLDAKARYLREREWKLAASALEAKARAFGAAVRADDSKRAANMFLAEVGHRERVAMIRELDSAELIAWLRGVKEDVLDAVFAAHPNADYVRRELAPPSTVVRLVAISRAVINGELAGVSGTLERPVDDATYKRLEAAGVKVRPWKGSRDPSDPAGWYCGWQVADALTRASLKNEGGLSREVMHEKEFLARVAFDDQFREQFTMGQLVAQTIDDRGKPLDDHKAVAALRVNS